MRITTAAASLLGCTILLGSTAHAQAARHYDCSKAGNANKAVCKNAAAAPASSSTTTTTTATAPAAKAERHYDCSKAGNANKAACKGSAPAAAAPPPAAPSAKKPSLLDRLRGHPAAAPSAPANNNEPAAPVAASGAHTGKSITADPAGATGQCKDGSYTHATHHSGACSHHGGVAKWMNG